MARKLGWVQFHHIENIPLFIVSDLLLPLQLYWFHPIREGAGQPWSSENGGGGSAGVSGGKRLWSVEGKDERREGGKVVLIFRRGEGRGWE